VFECADLDGGVKRRLKKEYEGLKRLIKLATTSRRRAHALE